MTKVHWSCSTGSRRHWCITSEFTSSKKCTAAPCWLQTAALLIFAHKHNDRVCVHVRAATLDWSVDHSEAHVEMLCNSMCELSTLDWITRDAGSCRIWTESMSVFSPSLVCCCFTSWSVYLWALVKWHWLRSVLPWKLEIFWNKERWQNLNDLKI